MRYHAFGRAVVGVMALWMVFFLGTGCDLFGRSEPEEARLRIEGEAGTQNILIFSSDFLSQTQVVFDAETGLAVGDTVIVLLLNADTINVSLPFERTFDIRENSQFFARIHRLSPETDNLWARLWIDNNLRSDQRPSVGQDSITIIYNFRGRPIDPDGDEA